VHLISTRIFTRLTIPDCPADVGFWRSRRSVKASSGCLVPRLRPARALRSLPALKALCEKLLSVARASERPRCCVSAGPRQSSFCGYGRGGCRVLPTCVFFLRRCLFSAEPDQLPRGAPWKVLWQWPAWLTLRRVYLHGRGGFPRAQTRRPVCWAICLRAYLVLRVPEFLFRASVPPC